MATTQEIAQAIANVIPIYNKQWDGKTIAVIGDSYVDKNANAGTSSYLPALQVLMPNTTFLDKGAGNSTIMTGLNSPVVSIYNRVMTAGYLTGVDAIVLHTSVNDAFASPAAPAIGDQWVATTGTPTYYWGALKQIILKMFEYHVPIYIVTHQPILTSRGTNDLQKSYRDAAVACAKYYNLPILDLWNNLGVTYENAEFTLNVDQVHLTTATQVLCARLISNFLRTGISSGY